MSIAHIDSTTNKISAVKKLSSKKDNYFASGLIIDIKDMNGESIAGALLVDGSALPEIVAVIKKHLNDSLKIRKGLREQEIKDIDAYIESYAKCDN